MKYFVLAILLFLFGSCNTTDEPALSGKVVSIADGDTFTLLTPQNNQVKVRLHGIDTPERGQDYGTVARQRLAELIFEKPVRIEEKDIDRYGRTVALVYTAKGLCINEQLLKDGLAWHYKNYDKNEVWAAFENEARQKKAGLWAQPAPVAPWNWRKKKRTPETVTF